MFSKYTDTHGCLGTRSLHRNDCLRFEGESGRDARVGAGRKGWGRGGGRIARVLRTPFLLRCPFAIQGVDQYNEAGPLIYHLFGNVIAFLAPRVFFVIGLHSSTVRSTLKPPYSTALLVIAFHDLSQHS